MGHDYKAIVTVCDIIHVMFDQIINILIISHYHITYLRRIRKYCKNVLFVVSSDACT